MTRYNPITGELISASAAQLNGGNGTALSAIARHPSGATTGLTLGLLLRAPATDVVARSRSGKVVDETIDGTDAYPAGPNFAYDAAGRLTQARVTGQGAGLRLRGQRRPLPLRLGIGGAQHQPQLSHPQRDGADRHMETKVNGATVVRYQRTPPGASPPAPRASPPCATASPAPATRLPSPWTRPATSPSAPSP